MAPVIDGNSEAGFMFASLMEFIHLWRSEKESTMSLKCKGGKVTIKFKCSLGHPDQPHNSSEDGKYDESFSKEKNFNENLTRTRTVEPCHSRT